jgi:sugar/nucleoside kinase (ribokinase family)
MDAVIGFSVNPEMVWVYKDCAVTRKMPATFSMQMGGTSLDVACTMKTLGHRVRLLGALGISADSVPFNQWLRDHLDEAGISFRPLLVRERTAVADVHVGASPISLSYKPPIIRLPREEISEEAEQSGARYAVVTGLGSDPNEIEMAHLLWRGAKGKTRVLNTNLGLARRAELFETVASQVDLLVCNHIEAAAYLGLQPDQVDLDVIRRIHKVGPRRVIVTCDRQGALYSGADGLALHQPIVDAGPRVDETGAGDCFLGAFLAAELEGHGTKRALCYAACAAGLKVLRPGCASIPSRQEVDELFARTERS